MDKRGLRDDELGWLAEREATPTHKRVAIHSQGMMPPHKREDELTFEDRQVATICSIRALGALVRGEEGGTLNVSEMAIELAFEMLQEIAQRHPDAAELAHDTAQMMMMSWISAAGRLTVEQIEREVPSIRPIARINAAKAAAVERGQAIAAELWQADTAQEIRLGDMADRVYRALVAEDFAESLPGSAERIKEWIKPAAPEYARKGGRRRKTP